MSDSMHCDHGSPKGGHCRKCDEQMTTQKKWTLVIGIHRGTITSRDTEQPKELGSLEECQREVTRAEREYASLGAFIWFATATSPYGVEHKMKYEEAAYL